MQEREGVVNHYPSLLLHAFLFLVVCVDLINGIPKKEYYRRYRQSDKFKESQKRYQQSDKFKESQKRYQQSDKYKESQKRYQQSDKCKESRKRRAGCVSLKQAKKDFFAHYPARKFRDGEDFFGTVKIYSENVCLIEGNCEQIQSDILLDAKSKVGFEDFYKKSGGG